MVDIAKIIASDRTIEIHDPADGDTPLGIQVTLHSPDNPTLMRLQKKIADKIISYRRRNKNYSADEMEADKIELLSAAISGWNWNDNTYKGKSVEFNPATVADVLTNVPWFRKQIDEELGDEKAFFHKK